MSQTSGSGSSPPPDTLPVIRASELAQYSFCHRAWWLGTVKGIPSQNQNVLSRGTYLHARHGLQVYAARRWYWLGLIFLVCGILLLSAALFWLWI